MFWGRRGLVTLFSYLSQTKGEACKHLNYFIEVNVTSFHSFGEVDALHWGRILFHSISNKKKSLLLLFLLPPLSFLNILLLFVLFFIFSIRLRRATGCWNEIFLYCVVSKVNLRTFLWWANQKGSLKKWRIWTWFHFWPITMEHNMLGQS